MKAAVRKIFGWVRRHGTRFPAFGAAAVLIGAGRMAFSQGLPHVQGSRDAITVVPAGEPTTQPATPAALPAGHPAISNAPAKYHSEGMQSPTTGALRVLFSQGTKGGSALAHDPVTVQLFTKGKVIGTYEEAVDAGGAMEIHDLPLAVPFQPVVTVHHAGADEQLVGPAMYKFEPAIEMDMKVYEVTAQKPAWTVGLRDVTVKAVEKDGAMALEVTEIMGGFNPADRAWTGEGGITLSIELPANAKDVLLGQGLAEAGAKIDDGRITRGKTMLPGSTEYDFGYTISAANHAATLVFKAPADTTLFALYIPGNFKIEHAIGLTAQKAGAASDTQSRQLLIANKVNAGDVLRVDFSNVALPPAPATEPSINDIPNGLHIQPPRENTK